MEYKRKCGILLHPTSLPDRCGVGSFGEKAIEFIDLLREMNVTLWQILPLGPPGAGDSPYAARSTFAGNELLVSLEELVSDGYLDDEDISLIEPYDGERVDYEHAREIKAPLLEKAMEKFLVSPAAADRKAYRQFCTENSWWLDDYALFAVLTKVFNDSRWFLKWPVELRKRDPKAIAKVTRKYRKEIDKVKACQFFFRKQWLVIKNYANENGIQIIGDIPIFVAADSVDAWTNIKLLKMDDDYQQLYNSGVPPDAFSEDGQLWGNPVYDWKEHERTDFEWWTRRITETLKVCDIIRIDHFRGFAAYWQVPAKEKTALKGRWVKSPGKKFIRKLQDVLGKDLPLIAEDLGVITPDVEKLRDGAGLPGMKIVQFAFGFNGEGEPDYNSSYLPHNCIRNSVTYTGTHDNDTTRGWFDSLDERTKDFVRRYFESSDEDIMDRIIRTVIMCSSKWVVFPMQDMLDIGSEGRMNTPATCGKDNWSWRMKDLEIDYWRKLRIADLNKKYGRA